MSFTMPQNSEMKLMGSVGNFDFHVEAVQADNNTNMEFNEDTDLIDADDVKLPETTANHDNETNPLITE